MKLLEPIRLINRQLKNRIAMAPMTRSRADQNGIIHPLTAKYYAQRASAGLIITEATNISPQAVGYINTPGIWNEKQINAWKEVTDAVHKKDGVIFLQLWHTGRIAHPDNKQGLVSLAPSEIPAHGKLFTPTGMKDFTMPREITVTEIKQTINDYSAAAKNAMLAGFDGVELHGAFGYLPEQFLNSGSNKRTDEYGGSIENRSRFVIEVMQALCNAIGSDNVGIKISPSNILQTMHDENPAALFTYLLQELEKLDLAYVQLMEPLTPFDTLPSNYITEVLKYFRPLYKGFLIANGGFNQVKGEAYLEEGLADMISYGVQFLANPDLPNRFLTKAEFNHPDRATFYSGGEKGYTDYPTLEESVEA